MSNSNNNKRVFKIAEFIANGSNVTSVVIGHKTNRIAATGGEDKKVNLWTLSKPTCIMSLTGHTSGVQSLAFSSNEDKIVSGSTSGALKVWDLEVNKLICNLVGHKSNVACVEFHAFADYIASGSVDSHIRLWDLRRKGCIFTYKGHNGCINSLKFSPDSKWIASSSEDTIVKIWDLKAGRLLTDLKGHVGSVNAVEFHPNEYLLASGSSDRTVRFWDLEKMEAVSSTAPIASAIKTIAFDPEGQSLFAGSQDYLHSFGWEPAKCHDSVVCQWKQVYDMSFTQNKLIGASFSQNMVTFHAVDLTQVAPIGTPPLQQQFNPNPLTPPPATAATSATNVNIYQPQIISQPTQSQLQKSFNSTRKNFHHAQQLEQPQEQPDDPQAQQQQQNENLNDDGSEANICDVDEYNKIFRPQKEIKRGPQKPQAQQPQSQPPAPTAPLPPPQQQVVPPKPPVNSNPIVPQQPPQLTARIDKSPPTVRPVPVPVAKVEPQQQQIPVHIVEKPRMSVQKMKEENVSRNVDSNKNQDNFGLNVNDFMPKAENEAKLDAIDIIASIDSGHDTFMKAMKNRNRNLQMLKTMWYNGNIKMALDSAVNMDDISVMADVLNQLNHATNLWTLDICTILLPSIKKLIDSKYEEHIQVGCDSCKIIFKNFGKIIKSNLMPINNGLVDLQREERQKKCSSCYERLLEIVSITEKKSQYVSNKLMNNFREINLLLKTLE